MKTLLLGANGQLGQDLCPRLAGEVVPTTRADMDLTNPDSLDRLREHKPDVVINCAAYNFVDQAEAEPEAAFMVNAWGVRKLAQVCQDIGAVLVHFSSDYVFGLDRSRQTPYHETDAPGPISVYGLSKLAGEYLVQSLCEKHFVIRTSGLYGIHGSGGKGGNFVETMRRLAGQNKPLRVVSDQILTPSYTVDVAEATVSLLATGRFGLYHITNSGPCSWFEFAQTIFDLSHLQVDLSPISSALYGAAAARPGYSVLASRLESMAEVRRPRPWQEALAAYLAERRKSHAGS
jgi:dTDP-4-dehydrorhamnose reductase